MSDLSPECAPKRTDVAAAHVVTDKEPANPFSGSSLVPVLAAGLALTLVGMIAAVVLS